MYKNPDIPIFLLLISIGLCRQWLPTTMPLCEKAVCEFPPNQCVSRRSRDISHEASAEVVQVHSMKVFTEGRPQHLLIILEALPQDLLTQDVVLRVVD